MLFFQLPRALVIAFDNHVHALHDIAVRIVLEGMMPFRRRIFGPCVWVMFWIHGKNFAGSISPVRSETDFTVTSWMGEA